MLIQLVAHDLSDQFLLIAIHPTSCAFVYDSILTPIDF